MSDQYESDMMLDDDKPDLSSARDLHLVFRVEDEDYAINVAEVADILPYDRLRRVPKTQGYLKGIKNNRGDIIPVICVRSKFLKPLKEYDFETCIVKVQFEEYALGLIVDRVIGVENITQEQIKSPPNAKLSYANQFIKNIGVVEDKVRMILCLEKLIF
jgi:purine-binding chemotaxis protein CheW